MEFIKEENSLMDNRVGEERFHRRCWGQPRWEANTWRRWGASWLGPEGSRGGEHWQLRLQEKVTFHCPQGLTQEPRTLIPQIRTVLPQLPVQTFLQAFCGCEHRQERLVRSNWEVEGEGEPQSEYTVWKKNLSSVKEKKDGKVVYKWYSFGLTISRPDFFFV